MERNEAGNGKFWPAENRSGIRSPTAQIEQEQELELVLIRHGHTLWNQEHRYLGHTDLPLLPEELEKLAVLQTAPALSDEFFRIFCSDLRRCRETLAAIAPHLERQAVYDPRLREMNFGAWEGCSYEQLRHNSDYRHWIDEPQSVTPPEGESWESFEARLDQFWSELELELIQRQEQELESMQSQEQGAGFVDLSTSVTDAGLEFCARSKISSRPPRILLVTHGGIIRLLLARLSEGVTFYTATAPAPGEIAVLNLRRDKEGWRIISQGE